MSLLFLGMIYNIVHIPLKMKTNLLRLQGKCDVKDYEQFYLGVPSFLPRLDVGRLVWYIRI